LFAVVERSLQHAPR